MLIAIDWDGTVTRDKALFRKLIELIRESGHDVIIATGRSANHKINLFCEWLPQDIRIIYCDNEYKKVALKKVGFEPDIWIDNEPQFIAPAGKLEW